MKRREFVKLSTATVALAAMPITLASMIKPSDIEWVVNKDPSIMYATRIMGITDINGRRFVDSYVIDAGTATQETIDNIKRLIMKDIERQYKTEK